MKCEGVKCEDVKCEGVRCEGVRCEGVRCEGVRCEGVTHHNSPMTGSVSSTLLSPSPPSLTPSSSTSRLPTVTTRKRHFSDMELEKTLS